VSWSDVALAISVLLASLVEFVEAFTIVLAMGLTRGWRSALAGTVAAIVVLAACTAIAGYTLAEWFPESIFQLVIGSLLLVFGVQWLRSAILRAAGLKAMHDEDLAFREETDAARLARPDNRLGLDWFGFVVSFKGVLLEGFEVVFIVITLGLNGDNMPLAITAAAVGAVVVVVAGIVLHRPLSRVPENTIKFAVGLLLATFGTFWVVEGLGYFRPGSESIRWPGGDAALLVLFAIWCAASWLTVLVLTHVDSRRQRTA
jgi:Ca2+/H+ antiporter, TMEM165/GDT1 family